MTKHFFLAAAMALSLPMCAVGARSQANAGRADSISNIEADTAAVVADTTAAHLPVAGQPFENDPRVVEIDDESYILSNGGAYRLTDVSDALAFNPIYDPDDFNEFYESGSRKQMLPVIAICFIVPCLTLIIGLVLLLAFFMKKTVARNSIIEKAIDAGYQLPDSFYSTTSAYTHVAGSTNADTIDGQSAPAPQPVATRDPKNFQAAATLLAVGFALFLFFAVNSHWGVACLAGGIPFLLGVGKLIGYLYIPGYTASDKGHKAQPRQPFNPSGNYPQQPPFPPQQPQNPYPGAYPPPFNNNRDNIIPRR